jgi:hypothetical protein
MKKIDMNQEQTQKNAKQPDQNPHINLQDEPFVGMWENHEAMTDSQVWLRKIRQQEWSHKPIDGRGDTGG